MAIQNRHGKWEDFDPSKMTTAEWGVVTSGDPRAIDGKSVYMAFSPGAVKRMATYEDMVENVNLSAGDAIASQIEVATGDAISACNTAAETANTAAENIQDMANNGDFNSSVTIGTVTTGEAGTQASVTNSGTAKDAVLDFVIPKGDTGSVENIGESTIEFTEATMRENIDAGESLKTLFGKIKKWFTDLGNLLSDLETKTYNIPKVANNEIYTIGNVWNVKLIKSGNLVVMTTNILGSMVAVSDYETLFNIPVDYRPMQTVYQSYCTQTGSEMGVYVTTSGDIKLFNNKKALSNQFILRQQLVWFTN